MERHEAGLAISSVLCVSHPGDHVGFEDSLQVHDRLNYGLITYSRIDHGVINRAAGPLDFEILFDEISAFEIDCIHQLVGLLFGLAAGQQSPHLIISRSVQKYSQCVGVVPENKLRSSSDDDAISRARRVLNDFHREFQYAFTVHELQLVSIDAALVTSAQKRFKEPVVERVVSLLSLLDNFLGAIGKPGDLLGQQLIPELPAEMVREPLRDFTAAASVLTFNRDNSDHLAP